MFGDEAFREYMAIAFGLLVGTMAHFGRKLADDEALSLRGVLAFLLQLGVIGLVASVSTRALNITDGDTRALATAVLAISAQEVVRYLKANGWGPLTRAAVKDDEE